MRISFAVKLLSTAAALALLAGCSNGSAIAPTPSTIQSDHFQAMPNHRADFNACPATGPIVYTSDSWISSINIYTVPFAGQAPCGHLTSGLVQPAGLFVRHHDLFVANTQASNVVVFHRGATTPYKTYTDPSCGGEFPLDVTVSNDDYVFATNIFGFSCEGSISIWHKQSGALVGTIPNPLGWHDNFLTIQKDGTLYYDDTSPTLYKANCAGGTCGSFSNVGASFKFAGGLRSADGEDLVLDDPLAPGGGGLLTYEPPDFTNPSVCTIGGSFPFSFDINHREHHVFVADNDLNESIELTYPGCKLIGTVPGNSGGKPVGIAKDFPETLH